MKVITLVDRGVTAFLRMAVLTRFGQQRRSHQLVSAANMSQVKQSTFDVAALKFPINSMIYLADLFASEK